MRSPRVCNSSWIFYLFWLKRPVRMTEEPYMHDKRALHSWQKSPICMTKEPCMHDQSGIYWCIYILMYWCLYIICTIWFGQANLRLGILRGGSLIHPACEGIVKSRVDTLGGFRRAGILHLARPMLTVRCVCHMYVWVMSHVCMSHVHIRVSHVTYMHEWCHIYVWVVSYSGWSQEGGYIASRTSDPHCQVCVSYVWISHVTYMYESWGVRTLWVVSGGRVYLF